MAVQKVHSGISLADRLAFGNLTVEETHPEESLAFWLLSGLE
jgi:hypothetical protein